MPTLCIFYIYAHANHPGEILIKKIYLYYYYSLTLIDYVRLNRSDYL